MLCVRNLEAARDRFGAMGFTLTPPAAHPFGTGNSLAQMKSSFIELLTVSDPARIPPHGKGRFSFAAHNADFLSREEGMSMLVISSEDARADEERWRKAGLTTFEPVYFERAAKLPDGRDAKVAFTIAFVLNEDIPNAVFFCCQQHAPDVFWKREYQRHPNGATDFAYVILETEAPRRHAAFFEALFGAGSAEENGEMLRVHTAVGDIEIIPAEKLASRFAGVPGIEPGSPSAFVAAGIETADLAAAEACLERGGVEPMRFDERLVVPPVNCFGLALEFVTNRHPGQISGAGYS